MTQIDIVIAILVVGLWNGYLIYTMKKNSNK
jgi:hypothetical protein